MPHGCSGVLSPTVELLANYYGFQPARTILDCGVGYGSMAPVVHAYMPLHRFTGIEAQECYRSPSPQLDIQPPGYTNWDHYTEVVIGDLREVLPTWAREGLTWEFGLFYEVLEHLPREDGGAILDLLPSLAPHWLMSTPDFHFETVGNAHAASRPWDQHVSLWTAEELRERGWTILVPPNAESWRALGWPMHLAYWGDWDLALLKCARPE